MRNLPKIFPKKFRECGPWFSPKVGACLPGQMLWKVWSNSSPSFSVSTDTNVSMSLSSTSRSENTLRTSGHDRLSVTMVTAAAAAAASVKSMTHLKVFCWKSLRKPLSKVTFRLAQVFTCEIQLSQTERVLFLKVFIRKMVSCDWSVKITWHY